MNLQIIDIDNNVLLWRGHLHIRKNVAYTQNVPLNMVKGTEYLIIVTPLFFHCCQLRIRFVR